MSEQTAPIHQIHQWESEAEMMGDLRARGYAPSRYVYPPGTRFPPHAHAEEKMAAVVSGRFRIGMAGGAWVLEAGQGIRVPAGVTHDAEVVGGEAVVSIDAPRMG